MFLPEMLEIIQNKKGACKRIRRRAFPGFLFRLTKRFVSEQSPDKINEGDRRPFSESVWPAPRPRPTPEDAGWSLSTGRGGLWLRTRELTCLSLKKQAAVWPNLVALSLHGFLQPFDSELEISITIQTTLWDSLIHLSKGLRCVTLPNSRASSRGGLHKVRSTYYSSSSLSLASADIAGVTRCLPSKSLRYVVCFGKASRWKGALHRDGAELGGSFATCRSGSRGLEPALSSLQASFSYSKLSCSLRSLKSLQSDYQKTQSIRKSIAV